MNTKDEKKKLKENIRLKIISLFEVQIAKINSERYFFYKKNKKWFIKYFRDITFFRNFMEVIIPIHFYWEKKDFDELNKLNEWLSLEDISERNKFLKERRKKIISQDEKIKKIYPWTQNWNHSSGDTNIPKLWVDEIVLWINSFLENFGFDDLHIKINGDDYDYNSFFQNEDKYLYTYNHIENNLLNQLNQLKVSKFKSLEEIRSNINNINFLIFYDVWKWRFNNEDLNYLKKVISNIWQNNELIYEIERISNEKEINLNTYLSIFKRSRINWLEKIDINQRELFSELNINFSEDLLLLTSLLDPIKKYKENLMLNVNSDWSKWSDDLENNKKEYIDFLKERLTWFLDVELDHTFNSVYKSEITPDYFFFSGDDLFLLLIFITNIINTMNKEKLLIKDINKILNRHHSFYNFNQKTLNSLYLFLKIKKDIGLWDENENKKMRINIFPNILSNVTNIKNIRYAKNLTELRFNYIQKIFNPLFKNFSEMEDEFWKKEILVNVSHFFNYFQFFYFSLNKELLYRKNFKENILTLIFNKTFVKFEFWNSKVETGRTIIDYKIEEKIISENSEFDIFDIKNLKESLKSQLVNFKEKYWKEQTNEKIIRINHWSENLNKSNDSKFNWLEHKYLSKEDYEEDFKNIILNNLDEEINNLINCVNNKEWINFYFSLQLNSEEEFTIKNFCKKKQLWISWMINYDLF